MFTLNTDKTVASVFTKFTKELSEVVAVQQQVVDTSKDAQNKLKASLTLQEEREQLAQNEITQAETAIKNISNLLGVAS